MSDFGEVRRHRGRKDYRCEWCGEPIPKGDLFEHYVGKWEGEFQNWRMHVECYHMASKSDDLQDGFSPFENARGTIA